MSMRLLQYRQEDGSFLVLSFHRIHGKRNCLSLSSAAMISARLEKDTRDLTF